MCKTDADDVTGLADGLTAIRRVLVVDDSRLQRRILLTLLTRWGFDVREAGSGNDALRVCCGWPPDLVLSDWMMPGMNGLEFCHEFRALPHDSYGYFILLTSKSEKAEVAHGLDAGADDFLTKPVNAAELRARIAAGGRILAMQDELSRKNRLIKSTLDELQQLYDSLDNDLIEAKKLQQSLVRERYRDLGRAKVSMLLRASGHVGGDLVGMFALGDNRVGLYGIDVSGHGISSALMTARLAGYLSPHAPEQNVAMRRTAGGAYVPRPPAETVAALNTLILSEMETEHYFTLLLADVDLASGQMIMVQAGHPCPAVQRADGRVEFVGAGGLPVGLVPGARYDEVSVTLAPGDRLMIHSDGVVECADPQGNLLDDDGLETILHGLHRIPGMACLDALIRELARFAGRDDFEDDISAIVLEFNQHPPIG